MRGTRPSHGANITGPKRQRGMLSPSSLALRAGPVVRCYFRLLEPAAAIGTITAHLAQRMSDFEERPCRHRPSAGIATEKEMTMTTTVPRPSGDPPAAAPQCC